MEKTTRFRALLRREEMLILPGAFSPFVARQIEAAGFEAAYLTGFGTAAAVLGRPDLGLLTLPEMVAHARNAAAAVSIPLLSDADTGYGNALNVRRTVEEFEGAGVAGIHIEDQVWPKRCGHMEGKQVIPRDEMVAKMRAAARARQDKDFVIIARTDARAVHGLDDAIERGRAYLDAGADVLFVEAPQSAAELERVARAFPHVPLLVNLAAGGKTPILPPKELQDMGYRIALFPVDTLLAAAKAAGDVLAHLRRTGTTAPLYAKDMMPFADFLHLIGAPDLLAWERQCTEPKPPAPPRP
ncbi:MAG TPA: isocitrate lyase/phosphoenolpyruvate mutase family protein [Candidatus Sulfotelmatobacter sp.]|nr:isocitrate lyase/phosphoenolpyruvate mutase family protein [Candidatus Sulfotelmatobacter sp.]